MAWVVAFRKVPTRYDRHADTMRGFTHLGCALICLHYLAHAEAEAH
jgi:hypothetical protein